MLYGTVSTILWVPKYRYRVLKDRVGFEVSKTIRVFSERLGCEVVELNVQEAHVHLLVMVPPNDHEDAFITPENERYCAGGSGTRSIKFLEI